jgi:hypothetical protein
MKVNAFEARRLCKYLDQFRASKGKMPTLAELTEAGFPKSLIDASVRSKQVLELYSDMTSGAVVKVYKTNQKSLL